MTSIEYHVFWEEDPIYSINKTQVLLDVTFRNFVRWERSAAETRMLSPQRKKG